MVDTVQQDRGHDSGDAGPTANQGSRFTPTVVPPRGRSLGDDGVHEPTGADEPRGRFESGVDSTDSDDEELDPPRGRSRSSADKAATSADKAAKSSQGVLVAVQPLMVTPSSPSSDELELDDEESASESSPLAAVVGSLAPGQH